MPSTTYNAASERARQRELMSRKRAGGRDLQIPPIRNERRRRRCGRDPELYLRSYFPDRFFNPFTPDQRELIHAVVDRIKQGGLRAHAAPRGDGKTSIFLGLTSWAVSYGVARFPVFVAATGDDAAKRIDELKGFYERNALLAADFPDICTPILALEGSTQRARAQTVAGARTFLTWRGEYVVFPTVPGSPASGAVVLCRGIEGSLRGLLINGLRPDLVLLDDIDTRGSLRSDSDTASRIKTIEQDILGLAGPRGRLAVIYACTVPATNSVAATFTDRSLRPAWSGVRRPMLIQRPAAEELWTRYVEQRKADQTAGDEHGRTAHAMYLAHRRAMDKGAIVSNPYRYNPSELSDGSHTQVSALQFCYDKIADTSDAHFSTEYQQAPPLDEVPETSAITAPLVQQKTNGIPQGVLPAGTEHVTAGIDVGGRVLHWAVVAWRAAAGHVVDYGTVRVHSPQVGRLADAENVQDTQNAILTALLEFRDAVAEGWPEYETGEVRRLDAALCDVGWAVHGMDVPVYQFTRLSAKGLFRASKGFGTGSGQTRYRHPTTYGHGRRIGSHWFATHQPHHRAWLYNVDADFWKGVVHTGFQTPADRPGSLNVYGSNPIAHRQYAHQILAEVLTTAWVPGKGQRTWWDQRDRANHWLDATALAAAAADMVGVRIVAAPAPTSVGPRPPTPAVAPGSPPRPPGPPRRETLREKQARLRTGRN
ncbi:MAG TPA: terminase gpA endonuclease subunit [Phycisphaerae bacterium]|nr:terminase gpA endonuclease subunit [Phycisphaerae bacterium]